MDAIEKQARGQQAANLLADELLQEAIREVRYAAHRAFERSGGDPEKLRRAADVLEAAAAFQRFLMAAASQGAAARKKIDAELQAGQFVRGIGRLVRNRDEIADRMPWGSVA